MKRHLQTIALAALVGVTASDVLAQQRPVTKTLASRVQAEWRTPITRAEIETGELFAVDMLNHNIGWAIGHHLRTTMLFRTADGGKSWERQTTFDGEISFLYDIGFADANNGWIVGYDHILRTTDGGESWSPVDLGIGSLRVTGKKLLVLGPDAIVVGTDLENKQIMRTLDGGRTWDMVGLVKDGGGGAGSENTVRGLALAETSSIFATTGMHVRGVIYRSDDGGHSWENVAEAEKPLYAIAFRGKRGVAVGEGIAFWTDDGGDTWRRVAMPGRRYAVDFIDANTVIAVGRDPHVVISRNGGKTWQPAPGPPAGSHAVLVDVAVVDPGWWFVAGQLELYHFIDPNHTEPIASARLPIPVDIQIPGGRALPRGVYDVMLAHRGDQHVLKLDRKGEVPAAGQAPTGSEADAPQEGAAELEAAVTRQKSQKPPICAPPCAVTLPADVTYEKEDIAVGKDAKSFFRISLEPTPTGVAVVVRTAVTPPRNVALALAAVGAPLSSEVEARQVAKAAGKGGGLLGRINPQATQQRLRAAQAAPPAVYKITLRHSLNVFGEKKK